MPDFISDFKADFQKLLVYPLTISEIRQAVAEVLGEQAELVTDDFDDGPLAID